MNNRTRQWFKANQMLDKYDPPVVAFVRDPDKRDPSVIAFVRDLESGENHVLLFRMSQIEAVREIYGDCLEVWG